MSAFTLDINDSVAVITFDSPDRKVNILDLAAIDEFGQILSRLAEGDEDLSGVIIVSAKKNNFIAGADLSIIEGITDPEVGAKMAGLGQDAYDRLAALPMTTVAAIHGSCLGGGLELALACDHRVASDAAETMLGLPETQLGIIPGFGGTQRLPRLVGLLESVRMITTGSTVYPRKALKIGLVDEVTKREYLMDAALAAVAGNLPAPRRQKLSFAARVEKILERNGSGRKFLLGKARKAVLAKTHGHYPAPMTAIDAIEHGLNSGLESGLENERRLFGQMAATETSRNLIRVFYLRESFAKGDKTLAADIQKVGVIGAGAMGGGIAALSAEKGIGVRLVDMSEQALGAAIKFLYDDVTKKRRKGRYPGVVADWIPTRLTVDTATRGIAKADVVIEAVAERMDVKRSVFASVASQVSKTAIIASNTSSLSITEMAKGIGRPERVAGLHFFNPVDSMPLVEVIRGEKTSEETVQKLSAFARRLGKIPVVVSDRPGFLVNRLLLPYLNGAASLLEEGADVQTVDKALIAFGMPMGAFILLDQVGADIATHASKSMFDHFGDRMQPSPILAALVEAGRLGKKSGKGFYTWTGGKRRGIDAGTRKVIAPYVRVKRKIGPEEVVDRLITPMINEATYCLEEKVVDSPQAVDTAMIFGAGFPAFTGGLLRYADKIGIEVIVSTLTALAEEHGQGYAPSETLSEMAKKEEVFYP